MAESESTPGARPGRGADPVPGPPSPVYDDPYGRFRPPVRALGLVSAVVAVALVAFCTRSRFDATPLPFDRAQWKGGTAVAGNDVPERLERGWMRHRMLDHLVQHVLLVGLRPAEVEELLGAPDHRQEGEWRWFVVRLEPPEGKKQEDPWKFRERRLRLEAERVVDVLVDGRRVKP